MSLSTWLRSIKNRVYRSRVIKARKKRQQQKLLRFEAFEPRIMFATRVFEVTTTTDETLFNGLTSLREAIMEANAVPTSDDVIINLPNSAYSIDRPTDGPFLGQFVFSESNPPFDPILGDFDIRRSLVINGNNSAIRGERLGRVFQISGDVQVTLNDLNILNGGGYVTSGGGLHVSGGADVTLNNVHVFSNQIVSVSNPRGGGLYSDNPGGVIRINGGSFSTNIVQAGPGDLARGGAIYLENGRLVVAGTEFRLNNATAEGSNFGASGGSAQGGAIFVNHGSASLSGVSFDTNWTSGGNGGSAASQGGQGGNAAGGAIYVESASSLEIEDSTFNNNRADSGYGGEGYDRGGDGGNASGGAIHVGHFSVAMTIERSNFMNNTAFAASGGRGEDFGGNGGDAHGGAIAASSPITLFAAHHDLSIRDTQFQNNLARGGSGNDALDGTAGHGGDSRGGAIHAYSTGTTILTVEDSPLLANRAMAGDGGWVRTGPAGRGGDAFGGAVHTSGSVTTTMTGTLGYAGSSASPSSITILGTLTGNGAFGGAGGRLDSDFSRRWRDDNAAGAGGSASGGAIAATGGSLRMEELSLSDNEAYAGNGGSGDSWPDVPQAIGTRGGDSGVARGGALFTSVATKLENIAFVRNAAAGGRLDQVAGSSNGDLEDVAALAGGAGGRDHNGHGLPGGRGGSAFGGAVHGAGGNLKIQGSSFLGNQAIGGVGGPGAAGADVHGGGTGGSPPVIDWEANRPKNGGAGGDGGTVGGGAIRVENMSTLELFDSTLLGNTTIAGRGGNGGRAGTVLFPAEDDFFIGAAAGSGGRGGNAYGGGVSVLNLFSTTTTSISDSLVQLNNTVAGDGGFGGNGGGGLPFGGSGGDGGDGGDAYGAGVYLDEVVATITRTTVQDNTVSAGWGGSGGYGGVGTSVGGNGGDGGDGGDASGGGIARLRGSLDLNHSTVIGNEVHSGPGGMGGFGGPGISQEGGDGGRGGRGGTAQGGGVFIVDSAIPYAFAATAVTLANNSLEAGFGGFGGEPGAGISTSAQPNSYQAAAGQNITLGSIAPLHNDLFSPLQTSAESLEGFGDGSAVLEALDMASYVGTIGGAALATTGGIVGLALMGAVLNANVWGASAGVLAGGALGALAGPSLIFVGVAVGGILAVAAGVFLTAKILAGGIITGDWEGAARDALGNPGGISFNYNIATLLGASEWPEEDEDPPIPPPPGVFGANGSSGSAEGTNLWGGTGNLLSLSRTIVAQGSATQRHWSRTAVDAGTPGDEYTLQKVNWGGGSGVPASGSNLMVAGLDTQGRLHVRMFDARGNRIVDKNETQFPNYSSPLTQLRITQLKQSLPDYQPPAGTIITSLTDEAFVDLAWELARDVGQTGGYPKAPYFKLSETVDTISLEDIRGPFTSDGTNLIGAVNAGYLSDRRGTTSTPLDPLFDSATRLNGGSTPTLRLLAGSPARRVIPMSGSDVSQNDFVWTSPADIGAWGGLANRAPRTTNGPFQVLEDEAITAVIGTDPDNDPLSLIGGTPSPAHGTLQFNPNGTFTYTPNANWFGQEVLNYQVTDGEFTRVVTTSINVTPINDAPVLPEPGEYSVAEDTVFELDLLDLVTDVDTPNELLSFRVFLRGPGNVELLGDGHTVRFTPAANYTFLSGFQYFVTDTGDGAGPEYFVDGGTQLIHFTPVNDNPVNILPESPQVDEDSQVTFGGLQVADVDLGAGTNLMRVTLIVEHGTISLATTNGLTFETGDGANDTTVSFSGSKSAIDAAMAELTYEPFDDFNGTDLLHILSDDLGNFGAGGPLSDCDTLELLVNPVNDAPTLSIPAAQTGYEDVRLYLTGVSVGDIDQTPADGLVEVELGVSAGTLRLGQTAGLVFNSGGNDRASMTLRGSLEAVNAALAGLSYLGNLNYSGTDAIAIRVSDLGNVGTGGPLSVESSLALILLSPQQQASILSQRVSVLQGQRVLSDDQASGLLAKLDLKGNRGDHGKITAFINQVEELLSTAVLTPAQANDLLVAANNLLSSITVGR